MSKIIAITMSDGMFDELSERAAAKEVSISELLRRAVSRDRQIRDAMARTGSNLYIGQGRKRKQVLLPE